MTAVPRSPRSRPLLTIGGRRSLLLIERNVYLYRRSWMMLLSGFFEPLFYLLSIGLGIGAIVGTIPGPDGQPIPYQQFVAPALLAQAAMNGAIAESTFNVFFRLNYEKVYDAVLATPLTTGDVALGEIGWAVSRGLIYSTAFMLTMWALDMAGSPWLVLAVPACVLIGFAFGAVGMALTTYMRSWADFEYVTTITLPLFLFSATFYPVSSYGDWAWVVQLSPLYHGVAVVRDLNLGRWEWSILAHLGVLLALSIAGLVVASRRIGRMLLT